MTTIDRLGEAGRAASVGRGRRAQSGATGFALPATAASTGGAGTIGEATPVTLLGAMLALQEVEANQARDRVARRHGEAILTALTALQVGLLGGAVHGPELGHLARLAAELPEAADPVLGMLVRAVSLRAEIELARRAAAEE
ncbi:MAG: flagellar assembly protein FliX [Acetobacteraceae bacterium]